MHQQLPGEALIAGDGKSQKVYDVVWGYIEASEDARALSEATGELRAAAAAPAGAKPTQHVDDVRRRSARRDRGSGASRPAS